jgi:hypothetical protein
MLLIFHVRNLMSIFFTIGRLFRKLHNEELHNLYSSPNIIRMMKSRRMILVGHEIRMGEKRNSHRILVGKPEGKRQLRSLKVGE